MTIISQENELAISFFKEGRRKCLESAEKNLNRRGIFPTDIFFWTTSSCFYPPVGAPAPKKKRRWWKFEHRWAMMMELSVIKQGHHHSPTARNKALFFSLLSYIYNNIPKWVTGIPTFYTYYYIFYLLRTIYIYILYTYIIIPIIYILYTT